MGLVAEAPASSKKTPRMRGVFLLDCSLGVMAPIACQMMFYSRTLLIAVEERLAPEELADRIWLVKWQVIVSAMDGPGSAGHLEKPGQVSLSAALIGQGWKIARFCSQR